MTTDGKQRWHRSTRRRRRSAPCSPTWPARPRRPGCRAVSRDVARHAHAQARRRALLDLVVLGEFNHGKSTFVNALLGAAVLPTGITPTTALDAHHARRERTRHRRHRSGRPQDDRRGRAGRLGDRRRARPGTKTRTSARRPASRPSRRSTTSSSATRRPSCENRLTLVDTPGVNDINEQRAEITYGYVPRADAVLFLLDAAQVLKQSERAFLEQRILRAHARQADLRDRQDRPARRRRARGDAALLPRAPGARSCPSR